MTTKEKQSEKEKDNRAMELAETSLDLIKIMNAANLDNGEQTDLLAMLFGLHLSIVARQCGQDAIPRVLERFAGRLSIMHPSLKVFVVER